MKNYHYRKNYEMLYYKLCNELGLSIVLVDTWSDFKLLNQMNLLLSRLGLMTFSEEELELDLI